MNKLRRAIGGFICAWKGAHGELQSATLSAYLKDSQDEEWMHYSDVIERVCCKRCGLFARPVTFDVGDVHLIHGMDIRGG